MDITTIQSILAGDKKAFKEFYKTYHEKSLMIAISITRNKELAKEATQETFVRVYRNIDKFNIDKPFDPWFYKILTNECNRLIKKEIKVVFINKDFEDDIHYSETKDELTEDLHEVIHSLDDTYRIPLILKYLNGFTEVEISEILTINQNTIKTRLHKARELIKKKYSGYDDRGVKND